MEIHWTTPLGLTAREMPGGYTVPLRFEEWLLYAAHLAQMNATPTEDDIVGKNPVSPYQVMELERNAARSENKALKLQLQQLQQQANQAIGQLAQQVNQMNLFIGAMAHAMGGKLHLPHASLDALRKDPHRMNENIDNDLKVTVIEVVKVDPNEQPAPAEAASEVGEDAPTEDAKPSLIEVVGR